VQSFEVGAFEAIVVAAKVEALDGADSFVKRLLYGFLAGTLSFS